MSALTRHVLFEKHTRKDRLQNLFHEFFISLTVIEVDEYPDNVFFMKNYELFFKYKKTDNSFEIYNIIWPIFLKYGYSYDEIGELISAYSYQYLKIKKDTVKS
jgi:hypothetical protein